MKITLRSRATLGFLVTLFILVDACLARASDIGIDQYFSRTEARLFYPIPLDRGGFKNGVLGQRGGYSLGALRFGSEFEESIVPVRGDTLIGLQFLSAAIDHSNQNGFALLFQLGGEVHYFPFGPERYSFTLGSGIGSVEVQGQQHLGPYVSVQVEVPFLKRPTKQIGLTGGYTLQASGVEALHIITIGLSMHFYRSAK